MKLALFFCWIAFFACMDSPVVVPEDPVKPKSGEVEDNPCPGGGHLEMFSWGLACAYDDPEPPGSPSR